MITYNGIELDYRADTLQSLIIKGGLTKIDNLTDRTGTSSTQFNLPRTAKNELAFGNITTEGSELTTSGSAFITLEGNVFSQGVLYVQGYDQDNFKCLFMGADNDFIKNISNKSLDSLFNVDSNMLFNDANIKNRIEFVKLVTLGDEVSYHFGHPFLYNIQEDGNFNKENVAPFFSVRHIVHKIFKDESLNLTSNFLDSNYGASLDYSCFDGTHLSSNSYHNGTEQIPSSAPTANIKYLDLGTALSTNGSITVSSYGSGSGIGKQYTMVNDATTLRIKGSFEYIQGELNEAQINVGIGRPAVGTIYSSEQDTLKGGTLRDGKNAFDFSLDYPLLAGDFIIFYVLLNTQATYPLSNSSVICNRMTISHDNIQSGNTIHFGDYITKRTQLEFLKGLIKQFNLVLDINGDNAFLELQDSGVEPIGTSPSNLPAITTEQIDITNIVSESVNVSLDYLRGDLIYLKQKLISTDYTSTLEYLEYQAYGSYLFDLNTFFKNNVETYESYFNCMLDSYSYFIKEIVTLGRAMVGDPIMTWDNYISSRYYRWGDVYNGTQNLDYTNSDSSTTNLDCLVNWSEPVMVGKIQGGLFLNTLNQKKNNKIIEVIFRDELGTIVNNRTEYIFNNQVYKIVEWNYDIIKKLVKAKLIMK